MIALKDSKTAQLYQRGIERNDAIAQGANTIEFSTPDCPDCACVQDGHCLCIPSKPAAQPAYSCEYHTGGKQGATLRELCKQA